MNKIVKGAIAGAAGVALLAGGAGTFALWNSTLDLDSGNIVAGTLLVADTATAGAWTVGGNPISLATYSVAPGDTLMYTKTVAVTVKGKSLVATLSLDQGSIVPKTVGNAADVALVSKLQKSVVLTATGSGIAGSNNVYVITAGDNPGVAQDVSVAVSITFPKSADAGWENESKLGAVSFSGLKAILTQN